MNVVYYVLSITTTDDDGDDDDDDGDNYCLKKRVLARDVIISQRVFGVFLYRMVHFVILLILFKMNRRADIT
jgi:hypothetical protein